MRFFLHLYSHCLRRIFLFALCPFIFANELNNGLNAENKPEITAEISHPNDINMPSNNEIKDFIAEKKILGYGYLDNHQFVFSTIQPAQSLTINNPTSSNTKVASQRINTQKGKDSKNKTKEIEHNQQDKDKLTPLFVRWQLGKYDKINPATQVLESFLQIQDIYDNGQKRSDPLIIQADADLYQSYIDPYEGDLRLYYDSGTLLETAHYSSGQKVGEQISYFRNGKMAAIADFQANLHHGKFIEYDENQNILEQRHYENDQLSGNAKNFYPNGQLAEQRTYKADLLNGKFEAYFPNGKPKYAGEYIDDKKTGIFKTYLITGQLASQATYSNGVLHGAYREYYDNGTTHLKLNFELGLKSGEVEIFYDAGKTAMKGQYRNNKQEGDFIYYKESSETATIKRTANIIATEHYQDGKLSSRKIYDAKAFKNFIEFDFINTDIGLDDTF